MARRRPPSLVRRRERGGLGEGRASGAVGDRGGGGASPAAEQPADADNLARAAGQATVEFALILPVLMVSLLLVVQAALVVRAQVLAVVAARASARAAAVDPTVDARAVALGAAPGLRGEEVAVGVGPVPGDGTLVRATVRVRLRPRVPLVGRLLHEIQVVGAVAMPTEAGRGAPHDSAVP